MASKSLVKASSSQPRWNYDVFLSFRGEDVRKTFVDHLYFALHQKGIFTFKDDERLERGKSIGPELLRSIEQSRFSVVVFSQNYASSSWCLDELAKIMECSRFKGQTVLPFFYNVDPSEVRKQTGYFGEVFAKHESDKVEIWRAALSEAASLSGWDLKNTADGHESKCIQQIVREILSKLADTISTEDVGLFGMESRIEEVNSLLDTGSIDIRVVGIWGLSGIGKTTLARAIFDQISYRFEAASFLHEVGDASKKSGLERVLEKLLSEILMVKDLKINNVFEGINIMKRRLRVKRVLLVLDDVDHLDQLEVLAGKHDWFGLGSRIIITTRDKQLLAHEVDEIHEARLLDDGEAIQLFSWKAFKDIRPTKDFEELSHQVIQYAGGLPLAIRVLGSALYGKNVTVWRSALDRLIKEGPHSGIIEKLKIGFDGLQDSEKKTFLDIACFFEGKEKDYVTRVLDSFGFYADISLSVLIEKSLIYLLEDRLCMHQLIREMGRHIVRQNFPGEPGKHSRLWLADDIVHVLTRSTGTENIEGILLHFPERKYIDIGTLAFRKMDKLRLLEIHNACVPQGPEYLPEGLRWIAWDEFPSKSMPPTFQADKLVGLQLYCSGIIQLWKGRKMLDKLKYMDLTCSPKLISTPDLTETPNLETLNLEGCMSLVEVHPSVGLLKSLVSLNLKDCTNLRSLPKTIHSESLEVFNLSGCFKLQKFPEIPENMECLTDLYLERTAIKELPSSIEHLPKLLVINLSYCKNLERLPTTVCTLKQLRALDLRFCSKLENLPENLGDLEFIWELGLAGTAIKELPSSIGRLTGLDGIDLTGCKYLTSLPSNICMLKGLKKLILTGCSELEQLPEELGNLECLSDLRLCGTAITQVPPSVGRLINLKSLSFRGCGRKTFESRASLLMSLLRPRKRQRLMSLVLPSLSGLCRLNKLDLSNCELLDGAIPSDLFCLYNLVDLNLGGNNFVNIPSINGLSQLRSLVLAGCKMLQALPELPSSLFELYADDCLSLRGFSELSNKKLDLERISFRNCLQLLEDGQSNNISSIFWQHFLQGCSTGDVLRNIILPGRDILDWFSNQNLGSSISVKLLPNWLNNKFRGFGVSAVFESITKAITRRYCCGEEIKCVVLKFSVITPTGTLKFRDTGTCEYRVQCFTIGTTEIIGSQHVCLAFVPLVRLGTPNNDWREVKFYIDSIGQSAVVKKWGIRPVYNDDMKTNVVM